MVKNEKWKVGKNENWKLEKLKCWKNWENWTKFTKLKIGLLQNWTKLKKAQNVTGWLKYIIRTVFWHAHVTLEKQNEKRHLCFCLPAWLHFVPLLASWGLLRLWFSRSWPDWFPWWHRHAVSSPKFKVFFF